MKGLGGNWKEYCCFAAKTKKKSVMVWLACNCEKKVERQSGKQRGWFSLRAKNDSLVKERIIKNSLEPICK
jgi:hypothetical protein